MAQSLLMLRSCLVGVIDLLHCTSGTLSTCKETCVENVCCVRQEHSHEGNLQQVQLSLVRWFLVDTMKEPLSSFA